MVKNKRAAAFGLAAVLMLVILASFAFVVLHADHDCTGEDCPVCEMLCVCTAVFKGLALAAAAASASVILAFGICDAYGRARGAFIYRSPVSLKIKLSD